MALTEFDQKLLLRCLGRKPGAWEDFVDRFMGLVVHVVNHTTDVRGIKISRDDVEDLSAEIFLAIVKDDFAVLRNFRGQASLATYLTVIARRVCVRELVKRKMNGHPHHAELTHQHAAGGEHHEERLQNKEEVERLLTLLGSPEADVVRMYHLEGKTYHEISSATGMPENSVGPTLSRAREKMRQVVSQ